MILQALLNHVQGLEAVSSSESSLVGDTFVGRYCQQTRELERAIQLLPFGVAEDQNVVQKVGRCRSTLSCHSATHLLDLFKTAPSPQSLSKQRHGPSEHA